jgi:hypothetical protein
MRVCVLLNFSRVFFPQYNDLKLEDASSGGDADSNIIVRKLRLVVDLRPLRLTTGRTYDHEKNKCMN